MSTDTELRAALAEAILGAETGRDLEDPAARLALVARVRDAETEVRELLQQSVNSARAAGHSWGALGETLGMSRQAVQQRFGRADKDALTDPPAGSGPAQRWLGPVTAFDEMPELELAGRLGWRTVSVRMFYHLVEHTPTQWEHRRVIGPARRAGWRRTVGRSPYSPSRGSTWSATWACPHRSVVQPAPQPASRLDDPGRQR